MNKQKLSTILNSLSNTLWKKLDKYGIGETETDEIIADSLESLLKDKKARPDYMLMKTDDTCCILDQKEKDELNEWITIELTKAAKEINDNDYSYTIEEIVDIFYVEYLHR